jgi:hypothetical protein
MHFVLVCPAYASARRLMWLNIEGNLLQGDLRQDWFGISLSPPRLQLDYLLGKSNSTWHFDTASVIDRHFRQFVLSAARLQLRPERKGWDSDYLCSGSLLLNLLLTSFSTSFRTLTERVWTPQFRSSSTGTMRRLLLDLIRPFHDVLFCVGLLILRIVELGT